MHDPLIIRKSPVAIIKNLILAQFLATAAYFLLGLLANYGEIYQRLNFSSFASYEVTKFASIMVIELLLTAYIFARWFLATYQINPNAIIVERGVLFRRRKVSPLAHPISASCRYSAFSQLFKYGTLVIRDNAMKKPIVLSHVPSPKTYLRLIIEQERENAHDAIHADSPDIRELLRSRERKNLEFKTTFRWDVQEAKVNKNLEKTVMKTIAAFMNSEGGHLVIGVDDAGALVGLASDYATLKKQNADGFENQFTNVFKEVVGPELYRFLKLDFHTIDQKEICAVRVAPSTTPAYMKTGNEEVFYIRTGNSTTPLQVSEVANYVRSRWRKY
ncbi:MAG: putative DNA binding domain-containing protein [Candidatus Liptonbacteria bacterium]|nr:putative DNA binding domain-containing protein [Candidatus Liptonbacteria bacterium]